MELMVFKSEKRILKENLEEARGIFARLYSGDKFSPTFFPDLNVLLKSFLQEEIKSNKIFLANMSERLDETELENLLENTFSISALLSERPGYIALIYRHCIHKFVARKHHNNTEVEDIVQEIVQVLISRKLKAIKKGYEGSFSNIGQFSSYLMVVVRNVYIDILRKYRNEPLNSVDYMPEDVESCGNRKGEIPASLAVEMEIRKLGMIFKLFGKSAPRFELFMKLKYRVAVNRQTVMNCYHSCSNRDMDLFMADYSCINDREMFGIVSEAVNNNESKPSKSDTLRKWIDIKIKEVISHLNKYHEAEVYNTGVFEDLVILFYQKDRGIEGKKSGLIKSEVG